ncbi:membrane dipeptidase [Candidatus Bipolaricaulota bacterium]|nr:membrane dipeptidase [Candidatus Bipolaricaulota bacterium]
MKVLDEGEDFLSTEGNKHISFPGMVRADIRAQIFACFVLSSQHEGHEYQRACQMIDAVHELAASTNGSLRIIRTSLEMLEAFSGGPRAGILSLEGADPLQGKADTLREFFERGVRSMVFAWQDNAFSGTAFGSNTPLTSQGRRLLGLCEELGVVVDVSHLSDTAFVDVVNLSERPFIASHSDCRSLCPSLRNLTDDMIRTLAERGGVMGINLSPSFLDPEYARVVDPLFREGTKAGVSEKRRRELRAQAAAVPRPRLDWVARHILHAINIGGEDCIGLGGDLDGIGQTPEGVDTVVDYLKFIPLLQEAGLSQRQIEKICYKNFVRIFSELLPS